jgi:hypothetical protein
MKLPIHKDQDFERLVADFVFILQEVKRVVQEVEPSLGPIILIW